MLEVRVQARVSPTRFCTKQEPPLLDQPEMASDSGFRSLSRQRTCWVIPSHSSRIPIKALWFGLNFL